MKEKQSKWALLSLLGVAVLLVGGFWILSPRSGSPSGQGNGGLRWYTLQFFADQSGWAVTSQGVLRTQDAGQHWAIVSPPDFTDKTNFAALTSSFLDARNAWIISPSGTQYIQYGNNQQPENARAFHTADGGKTWQKSDIPDTSSIYTDVRSGAGLLAGAFSALSPLGENRRTVSINQIIAPDTRTVLVAVSSSNVHTGGGQEDYTHIYSRLWRSSDGGQHWEKVWENTDRSFPNASGAWITFAPSTSNGLMSGSTFPDLLFTRDGKNWQQTTLPAQDVSSQDVPFSRQEPALLFNKLDGVMALLTSEYVSQGEAQYTVRFFLTHDGGQHWQKSGAIPILQFRAGGNQAIVSYLDRTHWLITGPDVLLRSDDGGQSWQRFPLAKAYRSLTSPSFISPLEGWAIGQSLDGKVLTSTLLHTRDGGKTWELVNTQVNS